MNRRLVSVRTGLVRNPDGEWIVVHTAICTAVGCRWDYPTPDKATAIEQAREHREWHDEMGTS